jgi:hypothetical protein
VLDADSIGPIDEFTLNDGTEVDPSLAFSAALHTGIYRDTFNAPIGIGFTVGSTQRLKVSASDAEFSVPITTGTNSVTTDSLVVDNDIKTSTIDCDGTIDCTRLDVTAPVSSGLPCITCTNGGVLLADGDSLHPAMAFASDTTLGIRRSGSGAIAFCHSNNDQYTLDDTKFSTIGKPIECGTITSGAVTASGDVKCPRYNIKVTRSATQSIANNTVTDVIFNVKSSGTNIAFSFPQSVFTIPVDGYYLLNGWVEWQSEATGYRTVYFRISGVDYHSNTIPPVSGTVTRHECVFTGPLVAGDTVRLTVFQTNTPTSALTIAANSNLAIDRLHD